MCIYPFWTTLVSEWHLPICSNDDSENPHEKIFKTLESAKRWIVMINPKTELEKGKKGQITRLCLFEWRNYTSHKPLWLIFISSLKNMQHVSKKKSRSYCNAEQSDRISALVINISVLTASFTNQGRGDNTWGIVGRVILLDIANES